MTILHPEQPDTIIIKIRERMYNLYDFSDEVLESVTYKTYARCNALAMVIKIAEKDSFTLYNKRYNELRLEYVPEPNKPWLHLTVYSIDDSMWRAFLPLNLLKNSTLVELWHDICVYILPDLTQDFFKQFTKESFGATEYDWN